ncbi:MAG: winged helix-turn-helix transcriptional regulator [Armatimonadetes bacterium]|nr:winged helix-turn-helix transcriptional regulator [Armatimonadota bacterium]
MFAALAEPNRRAILERLAQGADTVEAIAENLSMSTWNTLKHVRVLEAAGLVSTEKVGRKRICRLELGGLDPITAWTVDLRAFWKSNLGRLEAHLNRHD